MTAAHCLVKGIDVNVHFGINDTGDFVTNQRVPTANQHIHQWYLHAEHKYDIGWYIYSWIHLKVEIFEE